MVLNLFTGSEAGVPHRQQQQHQRRAAGRRSASTASQSQARQQSTSNRGGRGRRSQSTTGAAAHTATSSSDNVTMVSSNSNGSGVTPFPATSESNRKLFADCAAQIQRNLKLHAASPSTLHTLASYYTRVEPYIEGRPFCVSLSFATFLFHMQMARISVADAELYVTLIESVLAQIRRDEQLSHPFVQQVLRDHVFGLPSPTCRGGAHCVVLLQPQQYRAFAVVVSELILRDRVPLDIVFQFHDKLEVYCSANAPLVANRALGLLVRTVPEVRLDDQVNALQFVLRSKPTKTNLDFLLACYERLQRAVLDAANGPTYGRALAIHCSELFLRFRSPIRREYVERFLYPSLAHPDMAEFLHMSEVRHHLISELLGQCVPGMGTTNPFYLCLCALLQNTFDDEIDGAIELLDVVACRMPHAAYFVATLAVDTRMSVSMLAKMVIALARGAGLAMTGREGSDDVASTIGDSQTSVYNVLFVLREMVHSCSVTASKRAADMLQALRVAVPMTSIDALGKLCARAFDNTGDMAVDPQLLCAETAMVLHHQHIPEAVNSAVEYFRDASAACQFCGAARGTAMLCPVNGTVHVSGQTSVSRLLSTLAECAASKPLQDKLVELLRDPNLQMEGAVHFLTYHIIANAGQHRNALFVLLEPYIRATLMTLVAADHSGGTRGLIASEHKANVLMLHVKLCTLLAAAIDPSYLASVIKVFNDLRIRSNHDALALWYMSNVLLRNSKGNVDLLPTDPQENNYCIGYPACAPLTSTSADNAQALLRLLDRAHAFSPETRKLVGPCVCKLIQDFNLQAPNIVTALLTTHGLVPVSLASLADYALPVGLGSTFWSFFMRQVRNSAPARTSFMTALVRSIARRFRVESPADEVAISVDGVGQTEPVGHLFAVMVYEALKRNAPLARVVLYMISNWMRQADVQAPGKTVSLTYACAQLLDVVVHRGLGPDAVDLVTESAQETQQFGESVEKAAKLLQKQEPRLEKLVPLARRDGNRAFFHLTRRLQRKVARTVAVSLGQEPPQVHYEDILREEVSADNEFFGGPDGAAGGADATLRELQNAEDDGFFDVDVGDAEAAGQEGSGGLAPADVDDGYYADERMESDPLAGSNSNNNSSGSGQLQPSRNGHRHDVDLSEDGPTQPLAGRVANHDHSSSDANSGNSSAAKNVSTLSASTIASTAHISQRQHQDANVNASDHHISSGSGHDPNATSTSIRALRDANAAVGEAADAIISSARAGKGETVVVTAPTNTTGSSSSGIATTVTTPTHQTVGTSPIQPQGAFYRVLAPDVGVSAGTSGDSGGGASTSNWVEPDPLGLFEDEYDPYGGAGGDGAVESTATPHLQATSGGAADGTATTAAPSALVLEFLRTHQSMDSLNHELQQLIGGGGDWSPQYAAAVSRPSRAGPAPANAARTHHHQQQPQQQQQQQQQYPHATQLMPLQVDGRANNYGRPHVSAGPAPPRQVVAPVRMVNTTTSSTSAGRGLQQRRGGRGGGDVVDGERAITPVSGRPGDANEDDVAGGSDPKRPRLEGGNRGLNFLIRQNQRLYGGSDAAGDGRERQQQQRQRPEEVMAELRAKHAHHNSRSRPPVSGGDDDDDDDGDDGDGKENEGRGARHPNVPRDSRKTARDDGGDHHSHDGPRATPHPREMVLEGMPPTTPYGQLVLPAYITEQHADTAIRELRQVMGFYSPTNQPAADRPSAGNHGGSGSRPSHGSHGRGSLSLSSRRRIRSSATAGEPSQSAGSTAWWAEMSGAPSPSYAADPQYSMELF